MTENCVVVCRKNLALRWWFTILFAGVTFLAHADSKQLYLQSLTNFETYAESIWHSATYAGAPPDSGYWGDGGGTGNGGIRGNSGVAVAYAVLVVAQPGDPRTATRLARIRQALNYDANTHVTGSYNTFAGNPWGWSGISTDWQTPEWSASMGLACVLVQSNLPAATIDGVRRVVANEADHRAAIAPASGYSLDTKAEENAWQGNILALAAAWMNASNNAAIWLDAAKSYLVNTYTVASTNGDPLASWVTTQTLFPDYALENHNFYHPTYEMVAGMSSGDSLLMARLANTNIAAQLLPYAEHNVQTVWKTNLVHMLMDSGEFAYPSGLDWELHDYEQNSYITWMAAHFNDPFARWADDKLAQLVRYRQLVNADGLHDGMFVGPSVNKGSGDPFFREAVEARRTAIAWLHWANADFPSGPSSNPPPAVVHFADVGVIAQRSPWSYVTISYKDTIMGMVEATAASVPTNPFVATPALPGGFGHGSLGNPTSATLVSFSTNNLGFTAQLLLQNGANGSTAVYVNGSGESIGVVEVPFPANGVTGSSAGCFTNGIENDPLCGGSRLIEWSGGSSNVIEFSGAAFNITSSWVCVSSHYGIASGPASRFRYRAATGYNRAGAAQDYLHVLPQSRLGARYAVWFPGKTAAQTAALANQISWTTNGSVAVLSFPGANSTTQTISATLVSGNGTWTADASGNWSDSTKWSGGIIADGAGNVADFSTIDLNANRTVTLDSSRTIGSLRFGDISGAESWTLASAAGSVLALSATSPAIIVNQNSTAVSAALAGVGGFTKSGPGTLILSGTNSISGILYTDSNSTSANDGAVQITSSAAVANFSSIQMRDNTGPNAASTLQLNGTTGSVVVNQNITSSCRANTIPHVQNLGGSNVLAGFFYMQTGGSNVVFQSDSGTLTLAGPLQYIGSLTAGRSFNFFGAGDSFVTGAILSSANGAPITVGKFGSGTLTLRGENSFDGGVSLIGGTLNFLSLTNLGATSAALNFDGGVLQYAPGNTTDISSRNVTIGSAGAAIDTGTNSVSLSAGIGNGGSGSLIKSGAGELALNGICSYTGGTTISNGVLRVNGAIGSGPVRVAGGTLSGSGMINGPVTVLPAGFLAPGMSIGSLTIANVLTNAGTCLMELNKSGSTLTSDSIAGLTAVIYGGTLQLSITGGPLAAGDSFHLFYASNYSGTFANLLPVAPGPGLIWNTNALATGGTLGVAAAAAPPVFSSIGVLGTTNLVLKGSDGVAGGAYSVLAQTNIAVPLLQWTVVGGGNFDGAGDFSFTIPIPPGSSAWFFRMRSP